MTRYLSEEARRTAHTCHWPGCKTAVAERLWGCSKHWAMLPPQFQKAIWFFYRRGQEVTKTPSAGYLLIANAVNLWCQGMMTKIIVSQKPLKHRPLNEQEVERLTASLLVQAQELLKEKGYTLPPDAMPTEHQVALHDITAKWSAERAVKPKTELELKK